MTTKSTGTQTNQEAPSAAMRSAMDLMTTASAMAELGMRMQELADHLSKGAGALVTENGEDVEALFHHLTAGSDRTN